MSCITTISFVVLINGSASTFFHAQRGLRQGCSFSPILFLLVAKGLSRLLAEAKWRGDLKGATVADDLTITHMFFVDDILLLCDGSRHDLATIKETL